MRLDRLGVALEHRLLCLRQAAPQRVLVEAVASQDVATIPVIVLLVTGEDLAAVQPESAGIIPTARVASVYLLPDVLTRPFDAMMAIAVLVRITADVRSSLLDHLLMQAGALRVDARVAAVPSTWRLDWHVHLHWQLWRQNVMLAACSTVVVGRTLRNAKPGSLLCLRRHLLLHAAPCIHGNLPDVLGYFHLLEGVRLLLVRRRLTKLEQVRVRAAVAESVRILLRLICCLITGTLAHHLRLHCSILCISLLSNLPPASSHILLCLNCYLLLLHDKHLVGLHLLM